MVKGMGGAMDLVSLPQDQGGGDDGAQRQGRQAQDRLSECNLPLTGTRCVDRIITEMVSMSTHFNRLVY